MLHLENKILRMVANGAPLGDTTRQLCKEVEALLPGVVCAVMRIDPAQHLHPVAVPSLPEAFSAAIDGEMAGPEEMGRGGGAVTVDDIARDPKWTKFRDFPLARGLRACWFSQVVGSDGAPIGIVALYNPELRDPLTSEEEIIATCIELCGLALGRAERVSDGERQANVDALTGLPNRAAFNAALTSLPCEDAGGWALFVVDLDNLKTVNDTFGHQAGDALIRAVSRRIAKAMSPDATFRLGGDEFAVVIQNHEALMDLDRAAARIFGALDEAVDCDGHVIVPGATIGGAVFDAADASAESVYQNADFALYHAKETGRGGFVRYWPGIGTRITHRREAIRDVSAALDDDRIDAYYQPVVRLDTGEIVGVEALCRLKTCSGEIVVAEAFREATTDAHVAAALTSRMLSIVARDVRGWIDEGLPFQQVSVNVSMADFYTDDLTHKLAQSFGREGVSLDHLLLEVNEDVYVGRRDKVVENQIAKLRERGLRVALDDFGTGYASLTHLLNVPVDIIKIDNAFVARLRPGDPSKVIVEGVIDIARKLGVQIVAEGIETELQASQLWAMGCRFGQGFAFSRAVHRDAMKLLLHRHGEGVSNALPLRPGAINDDVVGAADRGVVGMERRLA